LELVFLPQLVFFTVYSKKKFENFHIPRKKKFWKNHPRGKLKKTKFEKKFFFFQIKIFQNFFFPEVIFRFFSSRLVFPEIFFTWK